MEMQIEKTYLNVFHEEGKLIFQYPAFIGTYGSVANEIDNTGLKRPNSSETASLIYDVWKNPEEKHSSEIISILKYKWFWEFTGNLYLPKSDDEINNGVILETNPKITNGELIMNKNSLIKRLRDNDPLVKFVPFGYKLGEQDLIEFKKNPYIIARYGKEGAEKITEVASKYENKPYLYSFNSVNGEKTNLSSLGGNCWLFGKGLNVIGYFWYVGNGGHAFGLRKNKD